MIGEVTGIFLAILIGGLLAISYTLFVLAWRVSNIPHSVFRWATTLSGDMKRTLSGEGPKSIDHNDLPFMNRGAGVSFNASTGKYVLLKQEKISDDTLDSLHNR